MATPVDTKTMTAVLSVSLNNSAPIHLGEGTINALDYSTCGRERVPASTTMADFLRETADHIDPDRPRLFSLARDQDVTGVSGTGRVADGVLWPDGTVTVRWRGTRASTVLWPTLADAEAVHGHGGATRIEWTSAAPGTTEDDDQ